MDWQSIVIFSVVFHVTGVVIEELRHRQRQSDMDKVLRDLRNVSLQLDRHAPVEMRRVK